MFNLEKRRLQGQLLVAFQPLKGLIRKVGTDLFCNRTRVMVWTKRGRLRLERRKIFFYSESGDTWGQVSQTGVRSPIPGNILGQVAQNPKQSALMKMSLTTAGGVGLDNLR